MNNNQTMSRGKEDSITKFIYWENLMKAIDQC